VRAARRRPGAASALALISGIVVLSLVAGVLAGLIGLPVIGMAGVAVRDAAETFNNLNVPTLARLPSRSEILDSKGGLIAYYYPNHIYRVPVSYQEIAPSMREAIVAIEDSRFYQHGAIDMHGTIRAVTTDLFGGAVQGGSTLAQQYVKNALLLTAADAAEQQAAIADDPARKIRELRIAANVEHELTPNQLLAAYLNAAFFDNEAYGVEVAARRYFGATAHTLTLTRSALLAGLVQNPSRYDPLSSPAAALARRNVVLARMAQLGYISNQTAAKAERTRLGLRYSPQTLRQGCQHGRRDEDLHHDEPGRPGRRAARGQLHGPVTTVRLQPGRQRGRRSAHPARHRPR
jgi:membrane peptidoglycan carboxypeptidase